MTAADASQSTSLLPQWWGFVHPMLTLMTDGQTRSIREIERGVVEITNPSEEARAETLNSGGSRLADRVKWAVTYTHRAAFLERVARGQYRLGAAGREWLARNPEGITSSREARQTFDPFWEKADDGRKTAGAAGTARAAAPAGHAGTTRAAVPAGHAGAAAPAGLDAVSESAAPEDADSGASPSEQIEAAVAAMEQDVAAELLTRLRGSDPTFFEEAVVKVLLAMGYGGAERRGRRIGGTGGGGVDGVIDQDALGLEQIYVQAKRYALDTAVGRPDIQGFVGALHGNQANQGVFITSGRFSSGARQYAESVPTRVVLIDGDRLAALMIRYGVGVQVKRTVTIVEVDEDFFE